MAHQEYHYEFTGDKRQLETGETVRRIRAVVDIAGARRNQAVKAGDLGGWIESATLKNRTGRDQKRLADSAWVADDACIYGAAWLEENARLTDSARCFGRAVVSGNARVGGNAQICGDAAVYENARVKGDAVICEGAEVYGSAEVDGQSRVSGSAQLDEFCSVTGSARVSGDATVAGWARLSGDAHISGSARVAGSVRVNDHARVLGRSFIEGIGRVGGSARINAEILVDGRFNIAGNALIESDRHLLTVRPIGPDATFALFYRTTSGVGEVAHGPWHGTRDAFARQSVAAVERSGAPSYLRTSWLAQYEAFLQLASACERSWG